MTSVKKEGGTVSITATKAGTPVSGVQESATYTLTITRCQPKNKQALIDEIQNAVDAHGNNVDLNYIDTSIITDMSDIFSSETSGSGLSEFNGDISKWNVSKVTNMNAMFSGATNFNNKDLRSWANKITQAIKSDDWKNATGMFANSGLTDPLPSWCATEEQCKSNVLKRK